MVLELRYGLLNGTGKTQREIAKMLGISRSYVSRIEKKAIKNWEKSSNQKASNNYLRAFLLFYFYASPPYTLLFLYFL